MVGDATGKAESKVKAVSHGDGGVGDVTAGRKVVGREKNCLGRGGGNELYG